MNNKISFIETFETDSYASSQDDLSRFTPFTSTTRKLGASFQLAGSCCLPLCWTWKTVVFIKCTVAPADNQRAIILLSPKLCPCFSANPPASCHKFRCAIWKSPQFVMIETSIKPTEPTFQSFTRLRRVLSVFSSLKLRA